jgi:hypothetical protein
MTAYVFQNLQCAERPIADFFFEHLLYLQDALRCSPQGRLAQLVEQSVYTGKVRGSSPLSPTKNGTHQEIRYGTLLLL